MLETLRARILHNAAAPSTNRRVRVRSMILGWENTDRQIVPSSRGSFLLQRSDILSSQQPGPTGSLKHCK